MTSQSHTINDTLRQLHHVHKQVATLRERLARGPRLQKAHQQKLQKLTAELEALRKEHKETQLAAKNKQGEYDRNIEHIEKRKGQLMTSGSNREYQALKDQIAADEMANSVLADEVIDLMTRAEELAEKVKQAEAKLADAQQEAEHVARKSAEETPGIRAELEQMEQRLKGLEREITGELKDLYDRAVRSMGSDALAPLRGGYCGGCNQSVPLNTQNQILLGTPNSCRACGRLLYPPEPNEEQ